MGDFHFCCIKKNSLKNHWSAIMAPTYPLALTIVLIIYMLPIDGCCTWFTLAMQSFGGFICLGQRKRNVVGVSLVFSIVEKATNTMLIVNDFTLEPLKWVAPITILMVHSQGPMKRTIVQTIQYNIKFT
jgi:hypothetical protein